MMKKGNELGMTPISDIRHYELKDMVWTINERLYHYNRKYMSLALAKKAYDELCTLGKELNGFEVPPKVQAKKLEITGFLRTICLNLKNYINGYVISPENAFKIQKSIDFEVAMLIREKKNGNISKDPLKYLEEIKELNELTIVPEGSNNRTDALYAFNEEILQILIDRYRINAKD